MKKYIAIALFSVSAVAFAQSPTAPPTPAARPNLGGQAAASPHAEKIRLCLEKKLGKPGQGAPPTTEKIQEAMNACGVKMPPAGAVRDQGTTPASPPAKSH